MTATEIETVLRDLSSALDVQASGNGDERSPGAGPPKVTPSQPKHDFSADRATQILLQEILRHLANEEREEEEADHEEVGQHESSSTVGTFLWRLNKGDSWTLAPECVFTYKNVWRRATLREPSMHERSNTALRVWKDRLITAARRCLTGEPLLFDLYVAQTDEAELGISSDEVARYLVCIELDRPVIARKSVYFGSQSDVVMRVHCPLRGLSRGAPMRDSIRRLRRTVYGPGWIYQKFAPRTCATNRKLILQIDGDIYCRTLAADESLRTDPRHAYAWDQSVSYGLVRFGSVGERLLVGGVPYQVEFRGPGRVWFSSLAFDEGYLGYLFTPSHWLYKIKEMIFGALGYLNPARLLH